jgi:hypothetical protein
MSYIKITHDVSRDELQRVERERNEALDALGRLWNLMDEGDIHRASFKALDAFNEAESILRKHGRLP